MDFEPWKIDISATGISNFQGSDYFVGVGSLSKVNAPKEEEDEKEINGSIACRSYGFIHGSMQ